MSVSNPVFTASLVLHLHSESSFTDSAAEAHTQDPMKAGCNHVFRTPGRVLMSSGRGVRKVRCLLCQAPVLSWWHLGIEVSRQGNKGPGALPKAGPTGGCVPRFVETSFSGIKINSKKGRGGRFSKHIRQALRPLEAGGGGGRGGKVGRGEGLNIKKQGLHISSCLTRTLPPSLTESSCVCLCGDQEVQ